MFISRFIFVKGCFLVCQSTQLKLGTSLRWSMTPLNTTKNKISTGPMHLYGAKKDINFTIFNCYHQTTADDMMYQKLRDLQMTNALIHWTTIPESTSRRHITRNNRACLCELVEESINISGPGPASTRQIIEV